MAEAGPRDEALELARALIRFDTSNPPGRETPAAEFLAERLTEAGAECELIGPDPERLNLVARVRGTGEPPSLMLLAHTDVVPAPAEGWSVPPFEGVVRDGSLVGRGAADMKGELAARAAALAALARSGRPPPGDVVLIAEADEERNTADVGMSWIVRERPDLRCDVAVNEGGGTLLELANGRRVVTVSVGEKRVGSLRIRLRGRGGHASVPTAAENPLAHLARAIDRLNAEQAPLSVAPALRRSLENLGAPIGEDPLVWAAGLHPELADLLPAMCRLTVTPTGADAGEPANVIPGHADLVCDVRALPGQDTDDVLAHVDRALAGVEHEVELLEPLEGGTESPLDSPLYAAIEAYVGERLPGAELLPIVTPGFTDSHWVRSAWGSDAYGVAPVFEMDPLAYAAGVHSTDESLAVADLGEMAEFHLYLARALG